MNPLWESHTSKVRGLLETTMILNSGCILEPSAAACNLLTLSLIPDQMSLTSRAGVQAALYFKSSVGDYDTQ